VLPTPLMPTLPQWRGGMENPRMLSARSLDGENPMGCPKRGVPTPASDVASPSVRPGFEAGGSIEGPRQLWELH
jgi:hypothetical protein